MVRVCFCAGGGGAEAAVRSRQACAGFKRKSFFAAGSFVGTPVTECFLHGLLDPERRCITYLLLLIVAESITNKG